MKPSLSHLRLLQVGLHLLLRRLGIRQPRALGAQALLLRGLELGQVGLLSLGLADHGDQPEWQKIMAVFREIFWFSSWDF